MAMASEPRKHAGPIAGPSGAGQAEADDPQQMIAQLELVQREIQRAERRLEALEQVVADAQQAASTLKALAGAKGEHEVLLPIGGGVHLRARLDPKQPAVVPVGAGYATDGVLEAAAAALEKRVEAASRSFQAAVQDMERLSQVAGTLNQRLEELAQAGGARSG